ncbi:MAG: class I SAM-dependent methyltransferase [Bacteriovoracaceae bacterium]|nr:class I SAM-dependent methyltransferase [Bacteriovoracaceae bacterium]
MNFRKDYWRENYSDIQTMDGIYNAKEHAEYVHSLLALHEFSIKSMVDIGFGYGYLLNEFIKKFKLQKVLGIEPSEHAYKYATQKVLKKLPKKVKLENLSIAEWCVTNDDIVYDFGICNSVFQYLKDEEVAKVVPYLAQKIKHLYFTVPTDREYERILKNFDFHDRFAIQRPKEFYWEILAPHFTVVSNRFLESKVHFTEEDSPFSEFFYRF